MTTYAYVTASGDDRLSIYQMDEGSGELSHLETMTIEGGPSPIAIDPGQDHLYICLRGGNEMAAYSIDAGSGRLTAINRAGLSDNACYLAIDREDRFLFGAYYGAGKVTVHRLEGDGAVGELVAEVPTADHAHWIETDRSNQFVFVPHTLPSNQIAQFRFNPETGALTRNNPAMVQPSEGEGPRHLVFHPDLDRLYSSNEDSSTVTAYRFDPQLGTLEAFQTLSTLPDGWQGDNTTAQIHIHPNGRWLYVSNRGHDSIAIFSVNGSNGDGPDGNATRGRLTALGQQPTEPTPRVFNLDPSGRFLYAAGQGSGKMAAYRIQDDGSLAHFTTYDVGDTPMWVAFVQFD